MALRDRRTLSGAKPSRNAERRENVQIISPDGKVTDPQQFRLDTQDGPQALGER